MPLFKDLKFPGNASIVTTSVIAIATFDMYPTHLIDDELYDFPESDPFNLNFQMCGMESKLLVENAGSSFWIITVFLLLAIASLALQECGKLGKSLHQKLWWGSLILLFQEQF